MNHSTAPDRNHSLAGRGVILPGRMAFGLPWNPTAAPLRVVRHSRRGTDSHKRRNLAGLTDVISAVRPFYFGDED